MAGETDTFSGEHPNVRRARFEDLVREQLVEPLRRDLLRRTDEPTARRVLAETLAVCWQRLDEVPDTPLPWARAIARDRLATHGRGRPVDHAADHTGGGPAPLEPEQVTALVEEAMREDATESRLSGTRGRSRLTWVVAGIAVLLIGLALVYALVSGPEDRVPVGSTGSPPQVVEVSLPAGSAPARCMAPSADGLVGADLAFDGDVAAVSGRTVTLAPARVYAGGPADEVRVRQAGADREALLLGVRFEQDRRYLVAAEQGEVMVCGFSGPYGDRLAGLYDEAFGSPE